MKVQPRLDPIVHAPKRLQLCAMLIEVDEGEFAALRDALDVSDSVLSKQLKVLEDAGYLTLNKTTIDSRVRTRASLTKAGRRAFAAHVAALQHIVAGAAAIAPGQPAAGEPVAATADDRARRRGPSRKRAVAAETSAQARGPGA